MTPSSRSASYNQADIPNSNYSLEPTNPDPNTYLQKQWASVFTHKGNPLSFLTPPSRPPSLPALGTDLLLILTRPLRKIQDSLHVLTLMLFPKQRVRLSGVFTVTEGSIGMMLVKRVQTVFRRWQSQSCKNK